MTISALNVTTTLVIPRALRAEVQEYCDRMGVKMGEVMRQALIEHLAEMKVKEFELEVEEQAA